MSQQPRSTQSATRDPSGNGCAIVLIFIGVAIALVATGVGFIAAFITIDESGAVASEPIVIDVAQAIPTSTPITEPSPTPIPSATPVPLEASETEDDENQEPEAYVDADYVEFASVAIQTLQDSFDRYVELIAASHSQDSQWQADFDAELELWETVYEEVQAIQAPEHHRASYDSLARSAGILNEIAGDIHTAIEQGQTLPYIVGVEKIGDSMAALFDANLHLQQEQRSQVR